MGNRRQDPLPMHRLLSEPSEPTSATGISNPNSQPSKAEPAEEEKQQFLTPKSKNDVIKTSDLRSAHS